MVYRTGVGHIGEFLGEVDIFQGLSERQLVRVAGLCEEWRFKQGDYLGIENERGSRLYVIRSGEITVTTGPDNNDVVVRTVRRNEAFPVAALFEPPILLTTTRAATDGEALVIPRVGLMELCELDPQIGARIYKAACAIIMNRYRYTLERLSEEIHPALHVGRSWEGAEV
jgi:CRP-like cAMP-binding protein